MTFLKNFVTHPLFAALDEKQIYGLLDRWHCMPQTFDAGQIIMPSGSSADRFGLLIKGKVQVETDDRYGNHNIFATLSEGELFAEAFAFSNASVLTVNVRAKENSDVLLLSPSLVFSNDILTRNLVLLIGQKMFLFSQRVETISQRKTKDKLLFYLRQQSLLTGSAVFRLPYNYQELADFLGVDRSGLSVALRQLKEEGIVEARGRDFIIKDRFGL